jgi:tripartite-type tricarboxylate transporter receptor subunit TctC
LLQPFLEQKLKAQIRIENRPEAGGVVGAQAIRDAVPDGKTLGLINASGLLAARAIKDGLAPDPTADFTILGQVVSNQVVLFTGTASGFRDINDLLATAESRPIVAGVRDAGSTSLYSVPVTAALLGIDYALVSGYVGSAARTLALIRGEVDVILGNFDSLQGQVRAGELIPLLQLTALSDGELDIPQLGGPEGLARHRAGVTGRTPQQAEQAAGDLAAIVGAGRLVVAPLDLPASLSDCLDTELGRILQSADLLQAADRAQLSIQYQNSASAHQSLMAGARGIDQFRDLISDAIRRARE